MIPLKRAAVMALKNVVDPEVGLDIVTLGLVYGLDAASGEIRLRLTLTTRGCPMGAVIFAMAKEALEGISGSNPVDVELVWSPPWSPQMIASEGRRDLRF